MTAEAQPREMEPTPLILKVFGWFLILGGVSYALGIIASGGSFSPERSAINVLSKLLAAVAGFGFLKLKRWAIYLYFGGFLATTVLFYAFPPSAQAFELYTRPVSLVLLVAVPAAVAAVVARYWSRFS